ncbi:aminotransferase class V-fold PLP-dependent enzyme [Rhabdobacter roseus]|uniref:Selenocysteine lyase/cysteine desulfurase n=1 Tax=Rhabdobacter roseus TaxID=1655419 RepID=A0A840TTC6_9BACT|nr:aminotransferase class V-fold PLP-dependent enzyme [Rhabdobacter roseus]MBB5286534.1 selenocysteine lyase/cysteine desulfurase [Rhabdobacter roseus]
MQCQKHLFSLDPAIHYLNCATRGPFTQAVEAAGVEAIRQTTRQIHTLTPPDFFEPAWNVRRLFSELIGNDDPERIALIPSVSYGLAVVARNLPRKPGLAKGQKIVLLDGEFPSDVYAWERVAAEQGLSIETVPMPEGTSVGRSWNERLLAALDASTCLLVCPPVHWMYGVKFELEALAARARDVDAWLVVDGTQSVGALPFDLAQVRPDALLCASYKWLMGPYSLGLGYFGEVFDDGIPLEETWMARPDSHLFHQLTHYRRDYRPKAFRYNVGEQAQFIQLPMLEAALRQLLDWGVATIQSYGKELLAEVLPRLAELGYGLEEEGYRAHHLLGLRTPPGLDVMALQRSLSERQVYVSARGSGIRVAPHVYNTPEDANALLRALESVV